MSTATDKAGSNHIAPTIPAVLKETIATIIVANDFVKVNTALADHPGSCTAMKNSAFTLGWSEVRYTMCWGKTLAWLQWQVGERVKELRANYPDHIIDVIAWWCGNEISEQWGCIPRLAPGLAYRDPTVTTEAVARKVRRSADALAALAGEPDVGFVKIIGQVEASLFQLHSACDLFNDAMFAEFRSRGLQTQSSVEKLEMYDSFHASEDERNRQVFQNYLHNTLNLTKAEWLAEKLSPAIHALLVRFKHQESGEQHNPIVEETFAKWREEKERILNPKIPQKPKHRIVTDEDRLWEAPDVARAEDLSKVILTPPEDKAIRKDVPLTSAPSTSASMTWSLRTTKDGSLMRLPGPRLWWMTANTTRRFPRPLAESSNLGGTNQPRPREGPVPVYLCPCTGLWWVARFAVCQGLAQSHPESKTRGCQVRGWLHRTLCLRLKCFCPGSWRCFAKSISCFITCFGMFKPAEPQFSKKHA